MSPQPRFHIGPDSDEARQIMDAIDRWLVREVAPHVMKLEHDDTWPAQMVEQMKALGLFGATISPQYGGLALTEPNAGTDLQAIRLRARREGSVYILNGTKTWI